MIRACLLALFIALPAHAATEAYFRSHETLILVRGVADDRDAVELFLAMKAPVAEIGNMWRKQIRIEGAFDLVCRASLITRALGTCTLKMAPGVLTLDVPGAAEKFEKDFATRDSRLRLMVDPPNSLKIVFTK